MVVAGVEEESFDVWLINFVIARTPIFMKIHVVFDWNVWLALWPRTGLLLLPQMDLLLSRDTGSLDRVKLLLWQGPLLIHKGSTILLLTTLVDTRIHQVQELILLLLQICLYILDIHVRFLLQYRILFRFLSLHWLCPVKEFLKIRQSRLLLLWLFWGVNRGQAILIYRREGHLPDVKRFSRPGPSTGEKFTVLEARGLLVCRTCLDGLRLWDWKLARVEACFV